MNSWKKVFAIIWTGQFLSILSSTIVNFAIILWISIETESAGMLAWATIAALLPQAVLGPFSGVFIDRWNRKRVMMLADSFIAFCTFILAILFWFDIAEMWHIFILLGLRSIGSAFHMPAMQASVPLLAPSEQLGRIAGINQIISSIANIAGPALGALFIVIWDMEYVLMLDVIGAFCAVTSLLFVHIPDPERKEEKKHVLHEMKEGFMTVLSNRGLSWIFLFSILATFFIMPVSVLFPLMTIKHFGGDAFQVSLIEILWSIGALAGGAVMGAKVYRINKVILVNAMYLLLGLTFLFSGILSSDGFVLFAVFTAIGGISGAVYNSSFTAIIQTNVDPVVLGRIFSLFFTMSLIPSMIGVAGIGFFADNIGITTSFIISGAILILIGGVAFLTPSALKIDQRRP
ncbi:MAG: MFS transporter [Bacteroidales bacterium]|jgi:DHA3 family macrolide efflux protein-like MFS transporter|nr:MFS transporter [Bacteroidales bacterium]